MHDNAAAYALDALDDAERRQFGAHLASCATCRGQIDELRVTASALAYDVDPLDAPEALERRILLAVRAERAHRSSRQRWALPAAAVAGVAAALAIGFGIWATHLSHSLSHQRTAQRADARALAVLAAPGARTIVLRDGRGKLVVAPGGAAVVVASNLTPPPAGKTYEAWVVRRGRARPAGLFRGGAGASVVALTEPAPRGSIVGVTIEAAGGSRTPTSPMILSAGV